jgi:hypothetical protein
MMTKDMQMGMPSPPRRTELVISDLDLKGRCVQNARMEECKDFMDNDAFVKNLVFLELV